MAAVNPKIVTRAQWGANPLVTPAGTIPTPSQELWLHHTAGEQFGAAGMRLLQAFTLHRTDANYKDLEYTFVYDDDNRQWFESRGPGHDSAATYMHNAQSHAICVMGNFEVDNISDAAIADLANMVAWGYERGWWPLGFTGGHRDASNNSTACPGSHLETQIPKINALARLIHFGTPTAPSPADNIPEDPAMSFVFYDEVNPPTSKQPRSVTVGADGNVIVDAGAKVSVDGKTVIVPTHIDAWNIDVIAPKQFTVPAGVTFESAVAEVDGQGRCTGWRQKFRVNDGSTVSYRLFFLP